MGSKYLDRITMWVIWLMFGFLLCFAIFPLIWLVFVALKTRQEVLISPVSPPIEPQWHNLVEAWIKADYSTGFINSGIVAISTVAIIVFSSSLAAYALARLRFAGRTFFLIFFLAGITIPPQIMLIPLFILLKNFGLLNTLTGLVLTHASLGLPLSVIILWGFMREFPLELEEAAKIEGYSKLGIFWYIVFPLTRPAIITVIILQSMFSWNEFMFALTFVRSQVLHTVPLKINTFVGMWTQDWPLMMSGILMACIPVIVVYLALQRYFIRGLIAGAIK